MTEDRLEQELAKLPVEAREPRTPLRAPRFRIEVKRIEERYEITRPWVKRHDAPDSSSDQYGYRPTIAVTQTEHEVLKVEVDAIHLPSIVNAVFNLSGR